jgi:hypothetical protein
MTHHMLASRARLIAGLNGFLAAASVATPLLASAADLNPFELVEQKPLSELWINPGFYSYHFDRERNLNDRNPGIGGEYRLSTVTAVTAGRFYNSDRQYSNYAGVYYQPVAIGPVRLGAVVGGFSGYPKMRDGGWFLAAIPVLSFEYQRVGANIAVIPRYKDRLYGALSIQLKFKLSE